MLFPLAPQTPGCRIFQLLNSEFLHFLEASIAPGDFSQMLFKTYPSSNGNVPSVCWNNAPTRDRFHQLWAHLPEVEEERQRLFDMEATFS